MTSDDIAGNVASVLADMEGAAVQGLQDWADYVLEQSARQVPLEEGTLLRSATSEVDADNLTVHVGYGRGAAAPYAVVQHEVTTFHHDPGRKDHYLSDPVAQSASVAERILAGPIQSVLS
jgi:hypothetical protein